MAGSSGGQASDPEEAESLIPRILALLAQVTERFESEEQESWRWLAQHSQNPLIVELLRDSTLTAMRVMDAIGRLEPVNGITISAQSRIPKGTISKVTRRLIAQNLVSTESLPHNKKEVLFRLTPLGKEFFHVHRAFDEQMAQGFMRFLQRYDPDDLRLLARVLHDAAETSFLTLGLQAPATREQAD